MRYVLMQKLNLEIKHFISRMVNSSAQKILAFSLTMLIACPIQTVLAQTHTPASEIGIVIMHGKGGLPTKHVGDLASALASKGYLVANLEMPWSSRRNYDVSVSAAETEVKAALEMLRGKGAKKLFVAGHSQGGLFALYFGSQHKTDGIIAVAPGGNVGSNLFREKLSASVEMARKLVADGKADEKNRFFDFESSQGVYPITSSAGVYLTWFDPDGAMNQVAAIKRLGALSPQVPVLYIAPKNDYPGLIKVNPTMFASLPTHPITKLYEPDASHVAAPSASLDEIVRWTSRP
jgi:pimeloyl-ACP methyl ester carboxylesterase